MAKHHIPAHLKCSAIPLYYKTWGGGLKNNKHSETLKITHKTELSQLNYQTKEGWDSADGIATHYGQDGSEPESWWGLDLLHLSRPAWGTTWPPIHWVLGFLCRGESDVACR